MPFLERKQIILAKIEATYGTDPIPAEGSNAILTKNLQRTIYEGNRVQRDLNLPYMGNDHSINTGPFVTVTFDVELARSGTIAVAPQYGVLLRACGLSETIVALASVTYAPVSAAFESITLYYNYDSELQKIIGARGTAVVNMQRGQIPTISFTFTGRYAKPTAVPIYNPTYTAQRPRPCSPLNTTTFSVHAQAVVGESFGLTLGNQIVHRAMLGSAAGTDAVHLTDRAPTASVMFEAVSIATKDYFAAMESHAGTITEGAVSIVHDVITLTLPTAQISNITESASDGIRMFNAEIIPVPTNAGNDELSIVFTG